MWRPFSVFSRIHQSPQCRCSDFPQAGMKPDPCRGGRGGGEAARKPGTRGWRHAGRRHGDTQAGDTQIGDAGTRRTETRGRAGRRRGDAETQMGPQSGKTAAKSGRAPPCLASSRDSARCVHYKQMARSRKRPGPVLIYRAATLRQQQAPRLRQPTHTTCNRCTHRQVRHMQQAQRRQAPKRLPTPRRTRA